MAFIDEPVMQQPPALMGWPRLRVALIASVVLGLLLSVAYTVPVAIVVVRVFIVALCLLLVFGLFERWPAKLPRWVTRWVLQVIALVLSMPFAAYVAYWITTGGHTQIASDRDHKSGFALLIFAGILFAPWIAVGALVRQRDDFARDQATAFALERSELERRALDARFRLLQAQVEPHFLFNTLANVLALVEAGAPQAAPVLRSLIAYLRAAVPRLHDPATTMGQELELVRAYLDVMHMRMPDRLQFGLQVEPATAGLLCPPMTLLTLVENAVRHGIDPSEAGGRIDIDVRRERERCQVRVTDSGVGFRASEQGLGTGLASLRERLQLAFGGDARLELSEIAPHGVCAQLSFPARTAHG